MSERRPAGGFTLVELLVAMVVLIIFMVGILTMLDRSRVLAKQETALSDTQENVRYAVYHLLRMARMTGGAGMPLANGTTDTWITAQIVDNSTGSFNDGFTDRTDALVGSDALILRGFFEQRPYFVDSTDFDGAASTVTVRDTRGNPVDPNALDMNDMQVSNNEFQNKGIVFMGRGQYAVAKVASNDPCSGCSDFDIIFDTDDDPWDGLNPLGSWPGTLTFEVYRAGFLESYAYYVRNDHTLMRTRNGGNPEPVAINIGNLQVALGMDSDDSGELDTWFQGPGTTDADTGTPVALRITVLGRTPEQIPDWTEPLTTVTVENLNTSTVDRSAKWRRMQIVAMLRDFQL